MPELIDPFVKRPTAQSVAPAVVANTLVDPSMPTRPRAGVSAVDAFDAAHAAPSAPDPNAPSFTGSFVRGFKRTLPEDKELLGAAGIAAGQALGTPGLTEASKHLYESGKSESEPMAGASLGDVVEGKAPLRNWAGDVLGNFSGQAVQSAAAGAIGALAGGAAGSEVPGVGNAAGAIVGGLGGIIGKKALMAQARETAAKYIADSAAKGVAKDVAEKGAADIVKAAGKTEAQKLGAGAGALALNAGQEVGSAVENRLDQGVKPEDMTRDQAVQAIVAGTAAGAIDTATEAVNLAHLLHGGSASPSVLRRVLAESGAGAVREGATEAAQSVLERVGGGASLTDDDAQRDYLESAAAGALGGGVLEAPAGIHRPHAHVAGEDVTRPTPVAQPAPVTPAGPISAGVPTPADTPVVSRPTAAPTSTPFPTAAPGSMADVANVIHASKYARDESAAAAPPAQPNLSGLIDPMEAHRREAAESAKKEEAPASKAAAEPETTPEPTPEPASAAPAKAPPPSVPWINAETGEITQPSDAALKAELHARADAIAGAGRGINSKALSNAWGVPAARIKSMYDDVKAERKDGVTTEQARVRAAAPVDETTQEGTENATATGEQPSGEIQQHPDGDRGGKADEASDRDSAEQRSPDEPEGLRAAEAEGEVLPAGEVATKDAPQRATPDEAPAQEQAPPADEPPAGEPARTNDEAAEVSPAEHVAPDVSPATRDESSAPIASTDAAAAAPEPNKGAIEPTTPPTTLDEAAATAATHPESPHAEPTDAQKEAGNYKKGHYNLNGLDVSIENPAGTKRRPEWPALQNHYGYIKRTEGADGEHVDVFMGKHAEDPARPVFVVDQVDPKTRDFDEHKVMLGFTSAAAARKAYTSNYSKGWKGFGGMREMSLDEFKGWLKEGDTTKPAAAQSSATRPGETQTEIQEASLPPILKRGVPLAEVSTGKNANGTFAVRTSTGTSRGGHAFPFRGEHATREDAIRAGLADVERFGPKSGENPSHAKQIKQIHDFVAEQRAKLGDVAATPASAVKQPRAPAPAPRKPPTMRSGIAANGALVRMTKGVPRYAISRETLSAYFKPDTIIPAYTGRDRVTSFTWKDDAHWSVKVREVDKDGNPIGDVRTHFTRPTEKDLESVLGPPKMPERRATKAELAARAKEIEAAKNQTEAPTTTNHEGETPPAVSDRGGEPDTLSTTELSPSELAAFERMGFRPDSTPKLRKRGKYAVDAIASRYGGSIIGDTITRDFREKNTAQLVGLSAKTADDFAALAQVYRNPVFETLHYAFVDDAGKIVGETAVSTRMPTASIGFPKGEGMEWLTSQARELGATGLWMMHNHPSGDPTPSAADRNYTRDFHKELPDGLKLLGHVVLNHTKYAAIDADGNADVRELGGAGESDPLHQSTGLTFGGVLFDENAAAQLGAEIFKRSPQDSTALLTVNTRGKVTLMSSFPNSLIASRRAGGLLMQMGKRGAGAYQIAVASREFYNANISAFRKARDAGLLRDVITIDPDGRAVSISALGAPGKNLYSTFTRKPDAVVSGQRVLEGGANSVASKEVREGAAAEDFDAPAASVDTMDAVLGKPDGSTFQRVKDWLRGKFEDFRPAMLGALQLRHLTELMEGEKPLRGAQEYADIHQRMDADRNSLMTGSPDAADHPKSMLKRGVASIAEQWRSWSHEKGPAGWLGRMKPEAKALASLMHDATIDGMDPSKGYERLTIEDSRGDAIPWTRENIKERIKQLRGQMRGRPGDDKTEMMAEVKHIRSLPGREKSREQKWPQLQARYMAMSDEAKQTYQQVRDWYAEHRDATEIALIKRIESFDLPENYRRSLIDRIRLQFEANRTEGVYFPLDRNGDFWLSVSDNDGAQGFKMFESAQELADAEKKLRAAGFNVDAVGRRDSQYRAKDAPSGTFVKDVIQQLKKSGAPETVQDEIYQMFLKTLPEMSMRKRSIHRKAIPGFSEDAQRAFAKNGFHGAHQLARLRFSHELGTSIEAMEKSLDNFRRGGAPALDIARSDALLSELKKRHDFILSPKDTKVGNIANSIGFIYNLAASPASALVNMTQGAQVTLPVLGAHHGWNKAMRYLGASTRDAIRTGGNIQRTLRTDDERRAYRVLEARGDINRTMSHTLAGQAEGNVLTSNPAWAKAMGLTSWMFHRAEIINREAAGMAAYRLAKSEGKSFEQSIQYASEIINGTHFDYSAANRPRYMQGNTARIALQFKNYSVSMTWLMYRNLYQAFAGETPEVKRLARRTLTGVLGMTSLLAGVTGLPIINLMKLAANAAHAAFGDDDEPWDFMTEFRAWLADHFGEAGGSLIADGAVNQLGVDVASRVSLSNLWVRDADRELEGDDAYYAWLDALVGPLGGMTKNFFIGSKEASDGNVWRGVEQIMPKAAKDAMKALRFAHEGVNSLRGDPIVPDVGPGDSLAQGLGFRPTRIAEQQRINSAEKNYEQHILDRREGLMNALAMAIHAGDESGRTAAMDGIRAFNTKYPQLALNAATIRKSMVQRARYTRESDNGIFLNKKIAPIVRDAVGAQP